ncbi:hypothetical protein CJ179_30740 [Rhodococcus sp. ACS1]|uniref:Uncharacterized protein n=1 Tax=Rhodococcus wratislaviensis TaxID=44752 RepID=A0A402CJ23_RHOWR|nr:MULTISPECIES: hypothetical protein [Rhodococcus]PBC45090.1 hypothetical protein CJ179_30740 [Rhodococcus sp. ACS1]QSE78182.1 hypothetical protein JWS14_02925 [Rhodococcus koreensis]QYB04566.1 hypothetical protein I1A62_08840 [Rhodococcus sp. USK10]GCE43577.1 hypothetical protein Rhow_007807 [Rhodococcus wratislaviensis]
MFTPRIRRFARSSMLLSVIGLSVLGGVGAANAASADAPRHTDDVYICWYDDGYSTTYWIC